MSVERVPWFGALTPGLSQAALSTVVKEVPQSPQEECPGPSCRAWPKRLYVYRAHAEITNPKQKQPWDCYPLRVQETFQANVLETPTLKLRYAPSPGPPPSLE